MKVCDKCGRQNPDDTVFCMGCGHMIGLRPERRPSPVPQAPVYPRTEDTAGKTTVDTIVDGLNDFIGNDAPVKLKWTDLFVSVMKKHTQAEAEDLFIYGTRRTTPPLYAVSSEWPKPWLYSRVLLVFVITYIMLGLCVQMGNLLAVPGLIAVGSMAFPLTTIILFYELNAYRNISIYYSAMFFLLGGGASLLLTLVLYCFVPDFMLGEMDYIAATVVSLVEETGKLMIVYFLLKRLPERNYILNGLLVGAAVGAGFSAFESAGYAFRFLLSEDISSMYEVIHVRAFFSPGSHIAWAAVSGAALVIAKGNFPITMSVFSSGKFWRLACFPLLFHMLWDCPLLGELWWVKCALLTVAVWVILMIVISMGLIEVSKVSSR